MTFFVGCHFSRCELLVSGRVYVGLSPPSQKSELKRTGITYKTSDDAQVVTITRGMTQLIWMFPKIGVPQNGWFTMENLIEMEDLGCFTPIFGNTHIPDNKQPPFLGMDV